MSALQSKLEEIVEEKSVQYLTTNSLQVYEALLATEGVSDREARAFYMTLLAGIPEMAEDMAESELCETIREECSLRRQMAADIAHVYTLLLEGEDEWEAGFEELIEEDEWETEVCAYYLWETQYFDREYSLTGSFFWRVDSPERVREKLEDVLRKNPYESAEDLADRLIKPVVKHLEKCFKEEVSGYYSDDSGEEDYFDAEAYIADLLEENGLAYVRDTCEVC